mgnify:CR=1 FL=1
MTNNTEKKSGSKSEVTIEALFEAYNATVKEANISEAAQKALDFAKQFNASVFDLPIPEEVKAELKAIEECTGKKEDILRSIHSRYESLKSQRDEITNKMDAIQTFLKRTTGKTSGRVKKSAETPSRASGSTVVGRWLVSPAEVLDIEFEEGKSPSTGFIRCKCPFCDAIIETNYNACKQHVARHEEAIAKGWVTWE